MLTPFVVSVVIILMVSQGFFGKLPPFDELENPKTNLATQLDWISWFLSELNNVDSIEIDVINYLKSELSKIN